MILLSNCSLPPDFCFTDENILKYCKNALHEDIISAKLHRRSVDARKRSDVHFCCSFLIKSDNEEKILRQKNGNITLYNEKIYVLKKPEKVSEERPVVVGFGPAGMFAALTFARCGLRPIVLERGKSVDQRSRDVEVFKNGGKFNPHSNVQFGEGGAGTFSDGKLTTGIKDPRCRFVLEEFYRHGADKSILYDAKPHIGTDVLKSVVKNIRNEIISLGGEVRFEHRLCDISTEKGELKEISVEANGSVYSLVCRHLLLCTGHSARDIFIMLKNHSVDMIQKPFSVGARIEHSQAVLDRTQLGDFVKYKSLLPTDYKLSAKLPNGRGVYTFCMCPGGSVINAASEENSIVTNGMSNFMRDAKNANSALLVGVEPADFGSDDPLAGIYFQREIERKAYAVSNSYLPPAQTVGDFLLDRPSTEHNDIIPSVGAVHYCRIDDCLPHFITDSMREGIKIFAKKLRGFDDPSAILTAPETRSSSPVRIIRNEELYSSVKGIIPCGEGAGYAGGIMSAAVDGIRSAEVLTERICNF